MQLFTELFSNDLARSVTPLGRRLEEHFAQLFRRSSSSPLAAHYNVDAQLLIGHRDTTVRYARNIMDSVEGALILSSILQPLDRAQIAAESQRLGEAVDMFAQNYLRDLSR